MNTRRMTFIRAAAAVACAVNAACGCAGEPGSYPGSEVDGAFGYAPSNVDLDVSLGPLSDLVFEGSACASSARIDTDDCRVDCVDGARCEIAAQRDGNEVAVLAVARFEVPENVPSAPRCVVCDA